MPGISVSKYCIPFGGNGVIDWDAYWASLISATVENAAPTHVVLTFPAAEALGSTDFTIAGFTISSASWTGAVLTLVLSTAVIYGDVLVVTFVTTGDTANVTNNVALAVPTGLTLTGLSGGVKIDWTDNSGGIAETEIWGQSNGAAYALLYTIAAGTVTKNDIIAPVDMRYYQIRAKDGALFSAFTASQSIALLGAELVSNGGFDDGTWWTKEAEWTIGGGTANCLNASGQSIYKLGTIVAGKTYKETVEVLSGNWGVGSWIDGYGGRTAIFITTIGVKTYTYVSASNDIGYTGSSAFTGSMDNVSIKEVLFP